MKPSSGIIYLIGAGPGDPGLLTLKAKECIEKADVVVYDYLAAPALLNFAQMDAELIYVGKKGGDHTLSQDGINDLLVKKGSQGLVVARLKGGDPFIFGRGGEEAEVLLKHGIAFEIVPGVTSAIAAPAYAGIPLTHREHTSSATLVTGHEDPTKEETSINWQALADSNSTLVFLMGVKNLANITRNLMAHGRPPETPVGLVRWGTTPKQRTVTGTLETIVEEVRAAGLKAPAVIVVGSVVSLRESLRWFDKSPLFGKRIVVTRAREQASNLVQALGRLGADCIELPAIQTVPATDPGPLTDAIGRLKDFDWLIFTSVNGVRYFFDELSRNGLDTRALGHLKVASIGPVTRERLMQHGIVCDVLPETYQAESIVAAFSKIPVAGKQVLLPRAREARSVLPVELGKMGALIHEVVAYETLPVSHDTSKLNALIQDGSIDAVTFTSSSTVTNFTRLLDAASLKTLKDSAVIACIGPITAQTAETQGFSPDVVATEFTIPGLVQALIDHFGALAS